MNLKKWFSYVNEKLKRGSPGDKNKAVNFIIIFLIGLLMVMTVSFFKTSDSSKSEQTSNLSYKNSSTDESSGSKTQSYSKNTDSGEYEKSIENKLKETLEKVQGVGKVEVMINFESGEEQVPAVNVNDSTNTTNEKDTSGGTRTTTQNNNGSTVVVTNNGEKSEPLIVKTYKPKVSGVCIVAEGAGDKITQLRIAKAVEDLFDITDDKVNVYPMNK